MKKLFYENKSFLRLSYFYHKIDTFFIYAIIALQKQNEMNEFCVLKIK
jgi:hypothetical protein